MKFSTFVIITTALIPAATQLSAQGLGGISHEGSTVSLAYNLHNDIDGQPYSENYTTMLSAQSSYSFGNNIGATLSIGYQSEQYADEFYSERYIFDVNPTYSFGTGTVGLYYTAISYDDGAKESHSNYGVTATFQNGPIGFEAYAGNYEEEDVFDHNPYGVAVSYEVMDAATIFVVHQRDSYESDDYQALTSIGGSYDLAGMTGAPIRITAMAGRIQDSGVSFSDSEWNQFTLAASYDIGGGSKSILNAFRSWSFYYD